MKAKKQTTKKRKPRKQTGGRQIRKKRKPRKRTAGRKLRKQMKRTGKKRRKQTGRGRGGFLGIGHLWPDSDPFS